MENTLENQRAVPKHSPPEENGQSVESLPVSDPWDQYN